MPIYEDRNINNLPEISDVTGAKMVGVKGGNAGSVGEYFFSREVDFENLKLDVDGEVCVFSVSYSWGTTLNNKSQIDSRVYGKKIRFVVKCENAAATTVKIYLSTNQFSSSIVVNKDITVNTPMDIDVPSDARYVWLYSSASASNINVILEASQISEEKSIVEKIDDIESIVSGISSSVIQIDADYDSKGISLRNKMNNGQIMSVTFKPFGQSNIWQLNSVCLYDENGIVVVAKTTTTDSVGPYQVRAVNNADGDNTTTPKFTGGCHGYNGDQTGSKTASSSVVVFADGKTKGQSSFKSSHVEIVVSNRIQGWNTTKQDGSGREILCESVRYIFDAGSTDIVVRNEINPTEDVVISLYYGMQIAFARDYVRFNSEKKSVWNASDINSKYVGNYLDSVEAKSNDGLIQRMSVDKSGLGHFGFVSSELPKAFQSGKVYYDLIRQDAALSNNESLFFDALYSFVFCGVKKTSLKNGDLVVKNERVSKSFNIEDIQPGTYKIKVGFSGTDAPEKVTIYLTSIDQKSTGIIKTYSNVVNGNETTIEVTSQTKFIWIYEVADRNCIISYSIYQ